MVNINAQGVVKLEVAGRVRENLVKKAQLK